MLKVSEYRQRQLNELVRQSVQVCYQTRHEELSVAGLEKAHAQGS